MKKISTAHILLLSVLILQVALSFVLSWSGIRLSTVPSLLVSQGTVILPFAIYCIVKRQNPFTLIRVKKISAKTALFSVLIAFASYPVAIFLNMLSMLFVENAVTKAMNDLLSLGLVPSLILIAALPAVVEETVFRGMLYNTYSMRRPLMAIILSAVLFGLMHGNLNQMPYTLFLGLVMAFLMEGADSILAPMIMHFTLNATSTILSWVTYDGKQSAAGSVGLRESLAESYRAVYEKGGMEARVRTVTDGLDQLLASHGYKRDGNIYRTEKGHTETIALFCHFGLEALLLSHLCGISPIPLWHHFVALPTSVTTLYTEERREGEAVFRCAGFGDTGHLYAGGEEPSFAARFCEVFHSDDRHD